MSKTKQIWVAYIGKRAREKNQDCWNNSLLCFFAGYLAFRMLYQVMMTVASFEIVKSLTRDCYAIVFGANTFVALGIQSILTAVVNSSLKLDSRTQFLILGIYFTVPLSVSLLSMILRKKASTVGERPIKSSHEDVWPYRQIYHHTCRNWLYSLGIKNTLSWTKQLRVLKL